MSTEKSTKKRRRSDAKEHDPLNPGRTAYELFYKQARHKLLAKYPNMTFQEISTEIARAWKGEGVKEKWEKKHSNRLIDFWWESAKRIAAEKDQRQLEEQLVAMGEEQEGQEHGKDEEEESVAKERKVEPRIENRMLEVTPQKRAHGAALAAETKRKNNNP